MSNEVTVEYGVNSQAMFLVGKTIEEAIEIARATWALPENLDVELNGEAEEDLQVELEDGDRLQLIKPSGDKGR